MSDKTRIPVTEEEAAEMVRRLGGQGSVPLAFGSLLWLNTAAPGGSAALRVLADLRGVQR